MSGRNRSKSGLRDKCHKNETQYSGSDLKKKMLICDNSPVVEEFKKYAIQMNNKQDKYERLVKISRDITIESKRVIFLLHTILRSDSQKVLEEAESRLNKVIETNMKIIKTELVDEDLYQYLRAFTGGLQEFTEAYTFLYYLKNCHLKDWKEIDQKIDELCGPESQISILPPTEYMLGVGDLSGELMRFSINSVVSGTADDTLKACKFVRDLYVNMLQSNCGRLKNLGRKLIVLQQSLQKMEKTVYTLRLRGSEMPRHILADVLSSEQGDPNEDEGFF